MWCSTCFRRGHVLATHCLCHRRSVRTCRDLDLSSDLSSDLLSSGLACVFCFRRGCAGHWIPWRRRKVTAACDFGEAGCIADCDCHAGARQTMRGAQAILNHRGGTPCRCERRKDSFGASSGEAALSGARSSQSDCGFGSCGARSRVSGVSDSGLGF